MTSPFTLLEREEVPFELKLIGSFDEFLNSFSQENICQNFFFLINNSYHWKVEKDTTLVYKM